MESLFFRSFLPILRGSTPTTHYRKAKSLTQAAEWIMKYAWQITDPPIVFIPAPPNEVNNYSPFEVMTGLHTGGVPGGSCTSLAIFLVNSLRSVGIPARVTTVPHWNKGNKVCPNGDADAPCGDT
eukprot:UN09353